MRRRAYLSSLWQRAGLLPAHFKQTVPGAIWLHAVSVGEAHAAQELVRRLRELLPRSPVFVSVSTLAGYETACRKLPPMADVFYAPVDYAFAVRRVLRTLRPSLVVVMETEIWPNLFRESKRTGAGLMLVNARISDRALPRYERWRWFFCAVLSQADLVLAQSEEMRQRFLGIGAPPERVLAGGNLKYDAALPELAPDSPIRRFLENNRPAAIWIAASTMPPAADGEPDEDEAVAAAFREIAARHPRLLLLLAPRKPERFDHAAETLTRAGIRFVRRSALAGEERLALPGALLLDSIGELSSLFALADVVFMAGTLVSRGGHNILEPALAGRPIVSGPHLENFADIAGDFRSAGALAEVADAQALAAAVATLLDDPKRAAELGAAALRCARARQGATGRAAAQAQQIFHRRLPAYRPPQPAFAILWLLSRIWIWGGTRKRRRDLAQRGTLSAKVISVGNITAGGTGKTPFVLHLVRKLKDAGWKPGILTRGHGRHSPLSYQVAAPGASLPVEQSGDEPQLFLRSGLAPVGIGADRRRTGRSLEHEFGANPIVLDDGFQHARISRDLDIVLIDALDPFGGCYPIPLGRLREPLEALDRADIFVITRSEFGRVTAAAEHMLKRRNPRALVFCARARPDAWILEPGSAPLDPRALPYQRVAAFCGLGNPRYFWQMLESLGQQPVIRIEFADHHSYRPPELRAMATQFREEGVQAVLTTEKDLVNLCEGAEQILAPLPLYWLRIEVELDREDEFLAVVTARLRST